MACCTRRGFAATASRLHRANDILRKLKALAGAGGGLPRRDRISDSGSRGLEESRVAQLQQDVTKFGVKSAISVAASAPLHAA
jgi:hypothetical protein